MAQRTRTDGKQVADTRQPDNTVNAIGASDTRETDKDLWDSSFILLTDDSDAITPGLNNQFVSTSEKASIASAEQTANKGAANGYASLDSSGLLPASQLPPLAISDHLGNPSNEAQMLLLVGERGDWCTRLDTGTNFQIIAEPSNVIGNWLEMSYPAAPVTSVNTKTGVVTLDTGDISETALKKYLTTATQTIDGDKTFTEPANFTQHAKGSRPVINESTSFILGETQLNTLVVLDIGGSINIEVDDNSNGDYNEGDLIEGVWASDSGSNSVDFSASGSQTIISEDSLTSLSKVGSGFALVKIGNNTWWLTGSLV